MLTRHQEIFCDLTQDLRQNNVRCNEAVENLEKSLNSPTLSLTGSEQT